MYPPFADGSTKLSVSGRLRRIADYSYREAIANVLFRRQWGRLTQPSTKLERDRPRRDTCRIEQPWDSWHGSWKSIRRQGLGEEPQCRKCAIRSKLTWPAAVTRNAERRCYAN